MPLYGASILYLYLPMLIFAWGWLEPALALVLTVLLAGTGWFYRVCLRSKVEMSRKRVIWTLVLAFGWTICVGAGGIGHPNGGDWRKHESVLKDLSEKPWPVVYDYPVAGLAGEHHVLVYYLAYYLPAAVVGKLGGWKAANLALFLWTLLGTYLVLHWVEHLVGRRPWAAALLFVVASGMDAIGRLLWDHQLFRLGDHIEWWAKVWQLSSNTSHLFWAPNQALGAWLAIAMLVDGSLRAKSPQSALLESLGAVFWSPLACIGLAPFVLSRLRREPASWLRAWPTWTTFPLICGIFTSFFSSLRISTLPTFMGGEIFGPLAGNYLLFSVLEFGLFWWISSRAAKEGWHELWWIAGVSLAFIPFGRLGMYNDFVMRASIPALFVLWLLVVKGLLENDLGPVRRWTLAAMVAVGALTPASEFARCFKHYRWRAAEEKSVREVAVVHGPTELSTYYLGDPEAPFFRYLARRRP